MSEETRSTNITWHHAEVAQSDRERLNGHKAAILWFTGLSGSGKSTLAHAVEKILFERGCRTYVLDGDNVRHGLNKDLGFSPGEREENIRRIGEVAALFVQAGVLTITAFISPYRADRDHARAIAPEGAFIEVFVDCPLNICEQRDPKGLYKQARAGEIGDFTGISAPYEAPLDPEIAVRTGDKNVEEAAKEVVARLEALGILPA
jgi:adenylylsulfate kinase